MYIIPQNRTCGMIERPILFNGEMVRAILAGKKSQTRRIVKPQPGPHLGYMMGFAGTYAIQVGEDYPDNASDRVTCPYGVPGDRLWVRETLWVRREDPTEYCYAATDDVSYGGDAEWKKKASIYCERIESRLLLEITEVRVQRVQEITYSDVIAEGLTNWLTDEMQTDEAHRRDAKLFYGKLWDILNAKRGFPWFENPWVWAISFKRITALFVAR